MNNRILSFCAAVLICGAGAWAADPETPGDSPQGPRWIQARDHGGSITSTLCGPTTAAARAGCLAVVTMPGPADAHETWFEIRNHARERLVYVIFSGYGGLSGQGLCFDSAQPLVHPAGGSLRIDHPSPNETGMGPLMVAFTGFDSGKCAGFQAEVAAWGSEELRARVGDLVGTRIDLVFEGTLRGSAEFQLCNASGFVRDRFHEMIACTPGTVLAVVVE